jgi:hypothetical protein
MMAMAEDLEYNIVDQEDTTDVFDPDASDVVEAEAPQPLYQIYEGSKIVVSKQVGKYWKNVYDGALTAYTQTRLVWEEVYRYYNHNQSKANYTPRGVFHRGDSTENIIFSNLNIMLPAIYSRNPDITCSTTDKRDEPFVQCLQTVLNVIFHKKNMLNAKGKVKKSAGVALLTNFGVLKIDWTKKNDSVEQAYSEIQRISDELITAKNQGRVEDLYGQLASLEASMEVLKPGGPSMSTVMPHNLIIDPFAEEADGSDAKWMCEKIWFPTAGLKARFTYKEATGEDDALDAPRKLIYKPTHKAMFGEGSGGQRDDGLGMVLRSLSGDTADQPLSFEDPERRAYIDQYFTECALLWDKQMKRVYLFHSEDWTWPLWVWDDPIGTLRFFPYFIISYIMSTGGTVSVGESAYYLDQQDELNDINRQLARIRRSVFDNFYYNSDAITSDEAESFVKSLRGETQGAKKLLGVRAGEGKIQDCIQAFAPPSLQFAQLFNKPAILESINRITNTSDALRGVQFKTNTNVASVQSYQESMRLSVGAKVDVIEDTVADVAQSLAEMCIQNLAQEDVAALVGDEMAQAWVPMTVAEFNQRISIEIVAGSMEKPNSVFKKKEAVEVSQAVGSIRSCGAWIGYENYAWRVTTSVYGNDDQTRRLVNDRSGDTGFNAEGHFWTRRACGRGGSWRYATWKTCGSWCRPAKTMERARSLPDQDKEEIMKMDSSGASPQNILKFIQDRTGA